MNDTHRSRWTNPEWGTSYRTNDFFNMLFSELVTTGGNGPNPTGAPLRTSEEEALELWLLRPEAEAFIQDSRPPRWKVAPGTSASYISKLCLLEG